MGIINKNKYQSYIVLPLIALTIFLSTFFYLSLTNRIVSITDLSIITAINSYRASINLNPLKVNKLLTQSAHAKALDMNKYNYFNHISPKEVKWSDFIKTSGYRYQVAGENLAKGYYSTNELVRDWLNSPSHKENILFQDYIDTGVSVEESINLGVIVVQVFGKPLDTAKANASNKE
jgi:uncharacterized protein YkwD